jgi:hypothetical protein
METNWGARNRLGAAMLQNRSQLLILGKDKEKIKKLYKKI